MLGITVSKSDTFIKRPEGECAETAITSHYRFANLSLGFPNKVPSLNVYAAKQGIRSRQLSLPHDPEELVRPALATQLYSGRAPLAGRFRKLRAMAHERLVYLVLDELPYCLIDLDHLHIHLFNSDAFDTPLNLEIITGPALLVLMADSNKFCLHAGAVRVGNGNVAFIAESGVGKSTLSKSAGGQWQQLADDIVPVDIDGGHGLMRSFPQLKMQNNSCGLGAAEAVELNAIVRLSPNPSKQVQLRSMLQRDAVLQLVRHTVGVKLFSEQSLAQHLDFVKELSARVPMIELSYPRQMDQLDVVRKAIINYLS